MNRSPLALSAPLSLLLTALLAASLSAEEAGEQQGIQKPFLWEIEGQSPSYLFGTIHITDPRVLALHPAIEEAFDSADAVYTEIAMDMATQTQAMLGMMLPGNQRLSQLLPEETQTRLSAELGRISPGLGLVGPLDRMRPWALAASLPMLEAQLKNPGKQALDAKIFYRALAREKEAQGLETVAEQLAIFGGLTMDEQIEMLEMTLDQIDEARAKGTNPLETLTQVYLAGDLDALQKTMEEWSDGESELSQRFETALLDKRNRLMAERIDALLQKPEKRQYFFAVGAAHYYGETGLLRLLQEKGYQLRRLP
ncbi:MAG: TraB/GumN family protein [Verrucomicrobiota bacterium]